MRLGVFGGTFDPPHNGHLLAAADACEALSLDCVAFVPNSQQPLKAGAPGASAPERLEMVRRLCQGDARFVVEPMEVERGGLSFTVDTLRALTARHSGAALFLLIGEDVAPTMPAWREAEEVGRLAEVVVLTRDQRVRESESQSSVGLRIATRRVDISSTEIRSRIARGLPLTGFVPAAVADYIEAHQLYRSRVDEKREHE